MNDRLRRMEKGKFYDMLAIESQTNQYMDNIADSVNNYMDILYKFDDTLKKANIYSTRKKKTDDELKIAYDNLVKMGYIKTQSFEDYLKEEREKDLDYDSVVLHIDETYKEYEVQANRTVSFLEARKEQYKAIEQSLLNSRVLGSPFAPKAEMLDKLEEEIRQQRAIVSSRESSEEEKDKARKKIRRLTKRKVAQESSIELERTKLRYAIRQIEMYIEEIKKQIEEKREAVNNLSIQSKPNLSSVKEENKVDIKSDIEEEKTDEKDEKKDEESVIEVDKETTDITIENGRYEYELNPEATMQNYRNSGYGVNSQGWYFNPSKDEYEEEYNPLDDPLFQMYDEYEILKVVDAEATMQNYRNSGYGVNSQGWYFNPSKDEYEEEYNPLDDPLFQVFTNEKVYNGIVPESMIKKDLMVEVVSDKSFSVVPETTDEDLDDLSDDLPGSGDDSDDLSDDDTSTSEEETDDLDEDLDEDLDDDLEGDLEEDIPEEEEERKKYELPKGKVRNVNKKRISKLGLAVVLVSAGVMVALPVFGVSLGLALSTGFGMAASYGAAGTIMAGLLGFTGLGVGAAIFDKALAFQKNKTMELRSPQNIAMLEKMRINKYVIKVTGDIAKAARKAIKKSTTTDKLLEIREECLSRIDILKRNIKDIKTRHPEGRVNGWQKWDLDFKAKHKAINQLKDLVSQLEERIKFLDPTITFEEAPEERTEEPPVVAPESTPEERIEEPPVAAPESTPEERIEEPPVVAPESTPEERIEEPPVAAPESTPEERIEEPPVATPESTPEERIEEPLFSAPGSAPVEGTIELPEELDDEHGFHM